MTTVHTPELKRYSTEEAKGDDHGGPPVESSPLSERKRSKLYTPRNLPLIITAKSTNIRESHKIIVERLDDGTRFKIKMTGHAPWTVRSDSEARSLEVASISISGTILALLNDQYEQWSDLVLEFRFGTSGCSVGNIIWQSLNELRAQTCSDHVMFVLGLMGSLYNV